MNSLASHFTHFPVATSLLTFTRNALLFHQPRHLPSTCCSALIYRMEIELCISPPSGFTLSNCYTIAPAIVPSTTNQIHAYSSTRVYFHTWCARADNLPSRIQSASRTCVIEAPHPRESLWQASDPQARRPDAGAKHRTHRVRCFACWASPATSIPSRFRRSSQKPTRRDSSERRHRKHIAASPPTSDSSPENLIAQRRIPDFHRTELRVDDHGSLREPG